MLADRQEITKRLPHAGNMCLLDEVVEIDTGYILCSTRSHKYRDNPLRSRNGLPAAAALEYAAQAMALHAGWSEVDTMLRQGVLAAAHDFEMLVERLDDAGEVLLINAERLAGIENGFMYSFRVLDGEHVLARGKATIMYGANA